MSLQSSYPSHSAQVDINLRLNGAVLPVSQLGPGFLILTQTTNGYPPTNACLVMQVDNSCEKTGGADCGGQGAKKGWTMGTRNP